MTDNRTQGGDTLLRKPTEEFFVCTAGGKQISVQYRPEMTVSDVKQYVEALEGCPPSAQVLIYRSQRLLNPAPLASLGVRPQSKVYMLLVHPDLFQVFVRIEGKVRTVDVLPGDTVGDVKRLACRTIRAEEEEYVVTIGKKGQIREESRLADTGMKPCEVFEISKLTMKR